MKLFLMRHGDAEFNASIDSQRQLTDLGKENAHQMATNHRDDLSSVSKLWVSPYVRAQQTADIVSNVLDNSVPRETQAFLKPSSDPNTVFAAVEKQQQSLLIVSHQPLIGTLVDLLAGLEPGSHRMSTASLACIEIDIIARACGELLWLHHPAYQPA